MGNVFVHRKAVSATFGKIGNIYLMHGDDPHMLVELPFGPDSDHCVYNMLSLKQGRTIYIDSYDTIEELLAAQGKHFTMLEVGGYVVIS